MDTIALPALVENPRGEEIGDIIELSKQLFASKMLPTHIHSARTAFAIIVKGRELGIPAMTAMKHIYVIKGTPACDSALMLALLARGGVTWEWLNDGTGADQTATIEFRREGFANFKASFAMAQANKIKQNGKSVSKKDVWLNYPDNMLRYRAISKGAPMIGPDLILGMLYTPEELGAEVDKKGIPVEGSFVVDEDKPESPQAEQEMEAVEATDDPSLETPPDNQAQAEEPQQDEREALMEQICEACGILTDTFGKQGRNALTGIFRECQLKGLADCNDEIIAWSEPQIAELDRMDDGTFLYIEMLNDLRKAFGLLKKSTKKEAA